MSGSVRGALAAEALKLRGTLAAWMCLVAPVLVALLYVLQLVVSGSGAASGLDWTSFLRSLLALWALLMLPLFVTLQAALVAGLEHRDRQWKHLLALPVPGRNHYLAKMAAVAAMLSLASLCLMAAAPLAGWLLRWLRPDLGLAGAPPWGWLAWQVAAMTVAAAWMAMLQLWLSLRCSSFSVAIGVGMAATIVGFLVGQSPHYGPFFPWSMPLNTLVGNGEMAARLAVAGAVGGLAFGGLALTRLLRRPPG